MDRKFELNGPAAISRNILLHFSQKYGIVLSLFDRQLRIKNYFKQILIVTIVNNIFVTVPNIIKVMFIS